MMVLIFLAMTVALVAAHRDRRRLAALALLGSLLLAAGEFIYEIDSPVDGFRLPWLQADARPGARP